MFRPLLHFTPNRRQYTSLFPGCYINFKLRALNTIMNHSTSTAKTAVERRPRPQNIWRHIGLYVCRLDTHSVSTRKKRAAAAMSTCRVQFRRPMIVVPDEMLRNFSALHMSPSAPPYDVCLSTDNCAGGTLRVPASARGKGGILTSAGWHAGKHCVIPHGMWVSRSCEATLLLTAIHCLLLLYLSSLPICLYSHTFAVLR